MLIFAPLFWERGCDLLLNDSRRHGDSTGQFGTFGYYEKADVLKVRDWFCQKMEIQASQVGLMGVSYGAATALQAAALDNDLAFVIADSPFKDMESILYERAAPLYGKVFTGLFFPAAVQLSAWRADYDPGSASPLLAARDIRSPVLIIHSKQDEFIDSTHSEAIFAGIGQDRGALCLTDWGAPHVGSFATDPVTYKECVDDFFERYVPEFGMVE